MSTVLTIAIGWLIASVVLAAAWALLARFVRHRRPATPPVARSDQTHRLPRQRGKGAA